MEADGICMRWKKVIMIYCPCTHSYSVELLHYKDVTRVCNGQIRIAW